MYDILRHFMNMAYDNILIGQIITLSNLILGIFVAVYELKDYKRVKANQWAWLKIGYAGIGIMWAIVYGVIFFIPREQLPAIGAVLARSAVLITLSVIGAGAYWSEKTRE